MKIQYKTPNIIVFESALFRTTSTFVVTDDLALLVDPNWLPIEIEAIQNMIRQQIGERPFYLLFTHSDYDHIIGYKAFPSAQVIASQTFANNPDKAAILRQIKDFDEENYIRRNYLIEYPAVDIAIEKDGEQIKIGETVLTFYLAPGHNADGIFAIIEPLGIWIAGDYLSNIEFPYIYHSSLEYERTIRKTISILTYHEIKMLVTGHGDIAFTETEILKRKKAALNYIHILRNSIEKNIPFDLKGLFQQYHFPKIMGHFHKKNIKLLKKEIEEHGST